MAVIRRPTRMTDSGVQPQRSVGEVLLEEAGRAGIGLVGGLAQAALQPVVTSLGPEGSVGRDFVSPEIREMKRQEAESMAAARVAPYYAQQQATQRTGMSEAAQTQRAGMGIEGAMEQKQLGEGSDILQLGMKLQAEKDILNLQLDYKERIRRAAGRASKSKRPLGMSPSDWAAFQEGTRMMDAAGKGQDRNMGIYNAGFVLVSAAISQYPELQDIIRKEPEEPFQPGATAADKAERTAKQKRAEAKAKKAADDAKFERDKELKALEAELRQRPANVADTAPLQRIKANILTKMAEFGLQKGQPGYAELNSQIAAIDRDMQRIVNLSEPDPYAPPEERPGSAGSGSNIPVVDPADL